MDELLRMATADERKAAEMILRDLINRRAERVTGEVGYTVLFGEGGIRELTGESKIRMFRK